MKTLKITAVAAVALAAAAYALPADLVVVSAKEVRPDEAAGFYYLGTCAAGYLYNGSSAAAGRVAPYRILDRDAQAKDYYIVWAPAWVGLTPRAFEHLGTAVRLSAYEILVGLERGLGPGALRAVEHRIELIKLAPVTPVEWKADAEAPPTKKDPRIEGAINTITETEYAGYIKQLEDFKTRRTPTFGYGAARDYLRGFFNRLTLKVTLFPFDYLGVTYHDVISERRGATFPEEIVIMCGHFDSTSELEYRDTLAPGAEDNASGTACAMAAARAFRNMSFKRTIRYVAFGGEEQGLLGSRAYARYCARKGERIIAVLNADMVCYDEDNGQRDDFVAGGGTNGWWMYDYLVAVGDLYGQKVIYDRGGGVSDDISFESVGYAAMGAEEGGIGVGAGFDYPYAHTTEDTLDKLHPALGVRLCRDLAAMLAHLAGVGDHLFEPEPPGKAATPFARPFAVYPNPYCYGTCAGGVSFVGIQSPATVEVYDLAGRRIGREEVAAGCDECVWRPAAPEGGTLSPGVYLYYVDGQEQKKAGKIVVAR